MIDRGAFLMGWYMGHMIFGLRTSGYVASLKNGILYIQKAPAKLTDSVLSFAKEGGE